MQMPTLCSQANVFVEKKAIVQLAHIRPAKVNLMLVSRLTLKCFPTAKTALPRA